MTLDGASVTLVCDNEAATFELEKNVNDPTYQLDPQQPDCDILLEIQDEVHSCTATLSIQWIEGHQEDHVAWSDLGFLAKLNVDCDTRAKAYLKTTVASSLPHPPVILSRERWGLIWGGQKVTAKIQEAVYEHYTFAASAAYLWKKFQWPLSFLPKLMWPSIKTC